MGISRKLSSNLFFICGNWSYSLRWVLTHKWKVSCHCDCSWHRTLIQFKNSLSNIVYLIEKNTENCREPESWSTWRFLLKICFSHFPWKENSISMSVPKKGNMREETLSKKSPGWVINGSLLCTITNEVPCFEKYWAKIQLREGTLSFITHYFTIMHLLACVVPSFCVRRGLYRTKVCSCPLLC